MRVLSLPQPFATLVVRGVKRLDVRTRGTDYRGRIAIHASIRAPSFDEERAWFGDKATGRRFADQGWLDRDDLKALPRSAIVGTAELVGVQLGEDVSRSENPLFTWNTFTDLIELATRDALTGQMRPLQTRLRPLPVSFSKTDYVWAFMRPVEVEPITDIDGKLNLWTLPEAVAMQATEREARSLAGQWDPPPLAPGRRAKAIRAWRERWLSAAENEVRRIEEIVNRNRELSDLMFKDPDIEDKFNHTFWNYLDEHGVEMPNGEEGVRLDKRLRPFFDGRDIVPRDEVEILLRRFIQKEAGRERALAAERRRREILVDYLVHLRREEEKFNVANPNIEEILMIALERMLNDAEQGIEPEDLVPEPLTEIDLSERDDRYGD